MSLIIKFKHKRCTKERESMLIAGFKGICFYFLEGKMGVFYKRIIPNKYSERKRHYEFDL
jgi:hypothetical protein